MFENTFSLEEPFQINRVEKVDLISFTNHSTEKSHNAMECFNDSVELCNTITNKIFLI